MKKAAIVTIYLFFVFVLSGCGTVTPSSNSGPSSGSSGLIALNSTAQMTVQFKNNTGVHPDSNIYIMVFGHTNTGVNSAFFYLDKYGNFKPCVYGENASNYCMRLSEINGLQIPKYIDSGRVWISIGSPIIGQMNAGSGSNVTGWAQPRFDVNYYYESFELAIVVSNQVNCNSSQVDCFSFPYSVALYTNIPGNTEVYAYYNSIGFTNSRSALWSAWDTFTASGDKTNFAVLKTTYRILAPYIADDYYGHLHHYFTSYISNCWTWYQTRDCILSNGTSTSQVYRGRVDSSTGVFHFTNINNSSDVWTVSEPTNSKGLWGDDGGFSASAGQLLAVAFHRGVATNTAYIWHVNQYYQSGPCNWYSKFLHDYAIRGLAYGFSYDDENNQNPSMPNVNNPRGVIVEINPF